VERLNLGHVGILSSASPDVKKCAMPEAIATPGNDAVIFAYIRFAPNNPHQRRMQMKHLSLIIAALVAAAGLVCAAESDDEKPVKFADLPAKVQQAVKQQVTPDQITKLTQENEDGKVVYDVEFTKAGKHGELALTADGTIVSTEVEVTGKDVPDAVSKTAKEQSAGGKIGTIMKVTEDGKTQYEVVITKDGKDSEIEIAPDGKMIVPEKKGTKEKD
jgi:uncharacterized membrane protein YkoI